MTAPMPNAKRQAKVGGNAGVLSRQSEAPEPSAAPIQNVELMTRSAWPRTRARDQLVDRRVDGGVLAANARARERAEDREAEKFHENAVAAVADR